MGLHVVLVGRLRPDLGTMGVLDGLPVADVRHLDAVCSTVEKYGGPSGSLIVTCQQQDVSEVRHTLAMVSVALPRVVTVLEPVPGPPLAVAVGSALIGGTDVVAAQLAAMDRMRVELWSAVWLPKVSKLSHPTPRIVQHARSWFSGGGFLAVYDAKPRVVPAAGAPLGGLENAPRGAMLAATESAAPAWVQRSLADTVRPISSTALRSWRNPADSYGQEDAAEFVLVPSPLLDGTADKHAGTPCDGCGQRHPRNFCPFCGMDATAAYDDVDVRGGVVR